MDYTFWLGEEGELLESYELADCAVHFVPDFVPCPIQDELG